MSLPPEALMKLMAGGGGASAAPGPNPGTAAAPGNEPPGGGPMATPAPKEGEAQQAMVNVSMVFQLLEKSLPAFGSQSDEGKAVLNALKTLNGVFGKERPKADELIPAQLQQLMQQIPGAGGGSPVDKAMGGIPPQQSAMSAAQ